MSKRQFFNLITQVISDDFSGLPKEKFPDGVPMFLLIVPFFAIAFAKSGIKKYLMK